MRKLLQCILFVMIICAAQAQQLSNQKYFEELLVDNYTNDEISSTIKNTVDDTFVLDSSRTVYYGRNYNDTTRYYYRYNSKKNIIEETTYTTIKEGHDASGTSNIKYEYFYNENNKTIATIFYQLNLDTHQWYIIGKREINYSDDGKKVERITFIYDTITNNYNQFLKTDNIYDGSGRNISTTKYELDEDEEWFPTQKSESSFDEQGRLSNTINYRWNDSENQLEYIGKSVIEYSEDGRQELHTSYYFHKSNSQWIGDTQTKIVWENGKLTEYVVSDWDNNLDQWIYNYKHERTYDSYGNETSSSKYKWDLAENNWKGYISRKSTFLYTPTGLIESVSRYTLDTTGQWIGIDKKEYAYNEVGKEILYIKSDWDVEHNDWIYYSKVETGYNSNDEVVTILSYKWDDTGEEWLKSRKTTFEYDIYGHNIKLSNYGYINETWELDFKEEYFYSKLVTNINNIISESQTIKVYPNPTNETFTIETQNPEISIAKIFDSNGQLIKNLMIYQGVNTYNISYLKSGVYFIQIPQKEVTVTKKLVKN